MNVIILVTRKATMWLKIQKKKRKLKSFRGLNENLKRIFIKKKWCCFSTKIFQTNSENKFC